VQCEPHKSLSGFHTADVDIQLRKRGISHIMLCSVPANLCVEWHLRDAEERGYCVTVINDAPPPASVLTRTLVHYVFIAHESIIAEEAFSRLA
jgi:nicotinamidase-related amidase